MLEVVGGSGWDVGEVLGGYCVKGLVVGCYMEYKI